MFWVQLRDRRRVSPPYRSASRPVWGKFIDASASFEKTEQPQSNYTSFLRSRLLHFASHLWTNSWKGEGQIMGLSAVVDVVVVGDRLDNRGDAFVRIAEVPNTWPSKIEGLLFHILCHITFMLCITIYFFSESLENSHFLLEHLTVSMLYCLSDHMNFVILCFRSFNSPRLMFFLVLFYFDFSKIEDFDYLSVSTAGNRKAKRFSFLGTG